MEEINNMRSLKSRLISFYIALGIFIALFITLILFLTFLPNIQIWITSLLTLLTLAFGIFATIMFFNYNSQKNVNKDLIEENKYNLHRESVFYNYNTFVSKISSNWEKVNSQDGYVIAFSCLRNNGSLNNSADRASELNGVVSDYICDLFAENKPDYKDYIYCYNRGTFIISAICNENRLNSLIAEIESNIYRIAKENDFRLYIQPYFGVYARKAYDTRQIHEMIACASLSREIAERNFETIVMFNNSMLENKAKEEIEEISNAIDRQEFVVYYQAKYCLTTKRFNSSEALVRWNSPEHGLVSPMKFIDKAENGGLIHKIDMFVFEQVCKDLNESKRKGRRLLPVSVNFSLYEFYGQNFIDDIINTMEKYNIPPSLIQLEITEGTTGVNTFLSIAIIKKIREYGIKVLMDDFGVGYSNFNNLKNMPFDAIKIDKSFIDNIVEDEKSRQIVKFMIEFIKETGMEAIAEGVDNQNQVDILKRFRLDTIQGFFYSRPIPYNEYEALLANNNFEKKGLKI